jgi:hypothetical protein
VPKQRRREQQRSIIEHIPSIRPEVVYTRVNRYTCTAALTNQIFDNVDLLGSWVMAATTVLGYPLAAAVRLDRVSLYGCLTTIGTPVTVSLEWTASANGGDFAPNTSISDTSTSVSQLAYISSRPPARSTNGFWWDAASTAQTSTLFSFTAPIGTVVDLHYSFVLATTEPAGSGIVLVAATVGTTYIRTAVANLVAVAPYNVI